MPIAQTLPDSRFLHKTVQGLGALPWESVPAGSLRALELELRKRELVTAPCDLFNPLWFLAETERNVYLWKHSLSLAVADQFDFWIHLEKLIDKRLRRLEDPDVENPFTNPLWGSPDQMNNELGITNRAAEREYLHALKEVSLPLLPHLHALSIATREVSDTKQLVLLP